MSSIVTAPSANLLADTIFANGLGAHPEGLVSEDETADVVQELLPLRQRMSPIMIAAHGSVDHKLGAELAMLNLAELQALRTQITLDRKSTRLNSSHVSISYAVFCLKKKIRLGYKPTENTA